MARASLTLALDATTFTMPLFTGEVTPADVDLDLVRIDDIGGTFRRMAQEQAFEAAEFSLAAYLMTRDRGDPPFVALPAFTSRVFRHGYIFVNADAGIDEPADLRGARIGVPEYAMTAVVWGRGLLQEEYGVDPSDVTWVQGGVTPGGREERVDLPERIDLELLGPDRGLDAMLRDGELDAFIGPTAPPSFDGTTVRRLFPDYVDVERAYYERTGRFPIMHTVVLRRDVYEGQEWVAASLYEALLEARALTLEQLLRTSSRRVNVPWIYAHLDTVVETMGESFWPYGVEANRETLEATARFVHDQGLTRARPDVDELFVPHPS